MQPEGIQSGHEPGHLECLQFNLMEVDSWADWFEEGVRLPVKIIGSYLSRRILLFEGQCRDLSGSVPQVSVLGFLWNIIFDGVLRLRLLRGCRTVCYADDTLVLVGTASLIDLKWRIIWALRTVADWIQVAGLHLIVKKLGAITFTDHTARESDKPLLQYEVRWPYFRQKQLL